MGRKHMYASIRRTAAPFWRQLQCLEVRSFIAQCSSPPLNVFLSSHVNSCWHSETQRSHLLSEIDEITAQHWIAKSPSASSFRLLLVSTGLLLSAVEIVRLEKHFASLLNRL